MKKLLIISIVVYSFAAAPKTFAFNIYVTANPLWSDAGVVVSAGQQVNVTATGTWSGSDSLGLTWGPSGYPPQPNSDNFLLSATYGSLIAYVGTDPYQGHWGDGTFFPQSTGYWAIGDGAQFTPPTTGELWLGINDDAISESISDNEGQITASIAIVPEPGIPLLLGICALTCIEYRRKAKTQHG